ncbi:putative L-sorbosone dehydrogenase [Bradyrhizobium sp. ORS 285]|uniref:PQQ-dependent sugar dehydrogenase n=1 Tax=Bradyrhizobium sp. ORS 285 TaxID=115808 RepID=UPI0002406D3C|nr:sorbosone dehydrogenase family protein [Bradyrhizobium sp. ORS 285]CCD86645.1 putative L-sorbosone dehydrogenase [Bradyrhizobium sp. ORS 285]SMX59782.1 putative L-sorbosone dehydrogenase [Bradyrhizobium sp. ORS 285]
MTRPTRFAAVAGLCALAATAAAAEPAVLKGRDAFGSWQRDTPGTIRLIRPEDLPKPGATASAANVSRVVQRPASAVPKVPDGFKIALFAEGLSGPRIIRTAPNGDIFVAETRAGRVRVLRPSEDGSTVATSEIFADRLGHPFGIAFYPSSDPQWVYVASTERVMRFPYRAGDLKASGPVQVVVPDLPGGYGHSTRDIVFTKDGQRMLVSVGSAGNVGEALGEPAGGLTAWIKAHPLGAAWGGETDRAGVLAFDPDGKNRALFASGIRNCVGLAIQPATGTPWCSTNERDGLGDDLVPDYVTRVKEGGFYGWPWYYMGDNEDPRHRGERADLKGKITVPDVLLQPHSASLGLTFYDANMFPPEVRGDAFAAEHGSWNRSKRTGYKVIRVRLKDGLATGEYEDFVTGFVVNDREVWGRPVGVTVARDGSLLISEDGNGTIWRVSR